MEAQHASFWAALESPLETPPQLLGPTPSRRAQGNAHAPLVLPENYSKTLGAALI